MFRSTQFHQSWLIVQLPDETPTWRSPKSSKIRYYAASCPCRDSEGERRRLVIAVPFFDTRSIAATMESGPREFSRLVCASVGALLRLVATPFDITVIRMTGDHRKTQRLLQITPRFGERNPCGTPWHNPWTGTALSAHCLWALTGPAVPLLQQFASMLSMAAQRVAQRAVLACACSQRRLIEPVAALSAERCREMFQEPRDRGQGGCLPISGTVAVASSHRTAISWCPRTYRGVDDAGMLFRQECSFRETGAPIGARKITVAPDSRHVPLPLTVARYSACRSSHSRFHESSYNRSDRHRTQIFFKFSSSPSPKPHDVVHRKKRGPTAPVLLLQRQGHSMRRRLRAPCLRGSGHASGGDRLPRTCPWCRPHSRAAQPVADI